MERELNCPHCGTGMEFMGVNEFQLGHETLWSDSHFRMGSLKLELYRCPKCGKVELFLPWEETDPRITRCPVCRTKYQATEERCPKCFTKREPTR